MRISDWSSDVCSSDLFPFGDAALKRAGMDYAVRANVRRHPEWDAFRIWSQIGGQRIVLLTTAGAAPLPDFEFGPGDVLLFGSESAGVPHHVHEAVEIGRAHV